MTTIAPAPTRPSLTRTAREIAALPPDAPMSRIEELIWVEAHLARMREAMAARPANLPAFDRAVAAWHRGEAVTP